MLVQQLKRAIDRWRGSDVAPKTTYYRAYILDDHGHIFDFAELRANDDDDAAQQARRIREGFDIEVWQLDRKVAALKSTNKTAQ